MDKKNQQSKNQYGTLTAKYDANNDYGGQSNNKKSQTQASGSNSQAGAKKVQTSSKNIGN